MITHPRLHSSPRHGGTDGRSEERIPSHHPHYRLEEEAHEQEDLLDTLVEVVLETTSFFSPGRRISLSPSKFKTRTRLNNGAPAAFPVLAL
jgi:hypothetical protein